MVHLATRMWRLCNLYKSLLSLLAAEDEGNFKPMSFRPMRFRPMTGKLLALWLACITAFAPRAAGEITVAAAADLNAALTEIAANYEKASGTIVRLSFGSSGNLFSQIQNGAPFDVFFSADLDYPQKLVGAGLADPSSLYRYAVGRLVLWVPASSSLDLEHGGMSALLDPSVKKIAIANPQHAPYGRAAVAALRHFGFYNRVADRLVLGENVSQAAQFVESGNAQVGIVALSHALAPAMKDKGRYWEISADSYPALEQGVVILSHSPNKGAATAFLDYLKKPGSAAVLRRYGFSLAEEPTPKEKH
jgi:molybdate transport system substrate-binding protein